MKKFFLLSLALTYSLSTLANCQTNLKIELFSEGFVDASQIKGYSKIVRKMERGGVKVTSTDSASFQTVIEAGIEEALGTEKDTLLSHIKVINKKGKIVFEDYKNKKIAQDKNVSQEDILNFIAKHVQKDYPTCGL